MSSAVTDGAKPRAGGGPLGLIFGAVGAAVVAGAAIAMATIRRVSYPRLNSAMSLHAFHELTTFLVSFAPQKKVVAAKAHPLKGSLDRRMKLFGHMAEHNDVERPPRRASTDDDYHPAPEEAGSA